jgi:hypothetical protein
MDNPPLSWQHRRIVPKVDPEVNGVGEEDAGGIGVIETCYWYCKKNRRILELNAFIRFKGNATAASAVMYVDDCSLPFK